VPTAFVSGRRLQIDYLKRYAGKLARIPWQAYDTNLFRYQYFNSWLLPKRAFKKAWRIARSAQIIERNWKSNFSTSPDDAVWPNGYCDLVFPCTSLSIPERSENCLMIFTARRSSRNADTRFRCC